MNSYVSSARFLGRAYKGKRDADAEATYKKALEIAKPEEIADAYSALASFYYARDRFDDVVTLLERGNREEAEDSVDLIYLLARFYRARGDEAKARRADRAGDAGASPTIRSPSWSSRPIAPARATSQGALEAAEQALAVAPKDETVAPAQGGAAGRDRLQGQANRDRSRKAARSSTTCSPTEPSNPGALFVQAKIDLSPQEARRRDHRAAHGDRTASRTGPRRTSCSAPRSRSRATPGRAQRARARARDRRQPLIEAQQVLAEGARGARRARVRDRSGPPLPEAAARRPRDASAGRAVPRAARQAQRGAQGARRDRRVEARRRGQLRARPHLPRPRAITRRRASISSCARCDHAATIPTS